MTKRHYFQSLIILALALYVVKSVFSIRYYEAGIIVLLAIICVVHTMAVRDDIEDRIRKKKLEKRFNDDGGRNGSVQGPKDNGLQ